MGSWAWTWAWKRQGQVDRHLCPSWNSGTPLCWVRQRRQNYLPDRHGQTRLRQDDLPPCLCSCMPDSQENYGLCCVQAVSLCQLAGVSAVPLTFPRTSFCPSNLQTAGKRKRNRTNSSCMHFSSPEPTRLLLHTDMA